MERCFSKDVSQHMNILHDITIHICIKRNLTSFCIIRHKIALLIFCYETLIVMQLESVQIVCRMAMSSINIV